MSVKIRILLPMIAVAIIAASTILISNIMQFSKFVDSNIEKDLDRALLKIRNEIELMERKAAIVSRYISNDPVIVNALESGNREALLARAILMYKDTSVEVYAITDTSGIVLVRPQAPEIYGDDLTMMRSVQSAISGKAITTTEGGAIVDKMAVAGTPIYNEQGQLIGAVVVGFRLDTEAFVDRHKNITGCEITVFRGNERVATTLFDADGMRAVGTRASDEISRLVFAGETFTTWTSILGNDLLTKYIPILDAENNVIGMLSAGYFLTEKTATVRKFITTGFFITLLILFFFTPLILFVTGHIAAPIKKRLDQVQYDALTGIYNRRYFDENIERVIKSLSRSGCALSLMMIDIDYFKKYNDTYGHRKGDDCLRTVAETLKKSIMRADDFVARYGGEEFVVVLPNTGESGAYTVANRLLETIQNCKIPHEKSDVANYVTISIGCATGYAKHSQAADDYVKRADVMLYESKQSGRNKYSFSSMMDSPPMSLASAEKTIVSLARKKKMTDVINEIAFMFLSQHEKPLEDILTAGIGLMADSINVDTISTWRNFRSSEGLRISQIYRWDRDAGATPALDTFSNVTYAEYAPGWERLFVDGKSVNSPVRLLPDYETVTALKKFGIFSVFATPIMFNDDLWGFVLFGDRCNERFFDDDSAEIMRSAAFLFANAIIRAGLEHEIIEAEERVKTMLDATPLCCELWDAGFNVIDCNEETVKFFGAKNKQAIIDGIFNFSPEFQPDGQRSDEKAKIYIKKAFAEGRYVFDWMHRLLDGTLVPVEVTLVRINYKGDYAIAAYSRDLREYNLMIAEIENSLFEAEEANRSKIEFLSQMSHEILTPMNAIMGVTQILKKMQNMTDSQKEYINDIDAASSRLFRLINDLLDLSDRKDKAFVLTESVFSFNLMFKEILRETSPDFIKKQQTFNYDIDQSIPASLTGDKKRLAQVITHLLTNAIKFTPERGAIHFSACVLNEDNGIITMRISIADNGIGIAKEYQRHIFNIFRQIDESMFRKHDGTGLGLPLTRRIIEMMGGRIWLDSAPEKGAKFTFTCKFKIN